MNGTPAQQAWVERVLGYKFQTDRIATTGGQAAPVPTLSLVRLGKARLGWQADRLHAIAEIGRLQAELGQRFAAFENQKTALQAALIRLDGLIGVLSPELEAGLDAVLNATDPAQRTTLGQKVKMMLAGVAKTLMGDALMQALDGNEVLPDMQVMAPLRRRMSEIAGALV
jgi:hypothetical protein